MMKCAGDPWWRWRYPLAMSSLLLTCSLTYLLQTPEIRSELELQTNHRRRFHNHGEGPYCLIRDCENFANGSFAALIFNMLYGAMCVV